MNKKIFMAQKMKYTCNIVVKNIFSLCRKGGKWGTRTPALYTEFRLRLKLLKEVKTFTDIFGW